MQTPLTPLYRLCGGLAAFFLLMIGVAVMTSVVSRAMGFSIRGLTGYASYCMAASSFLALAYTFAMNAHIRVSIILQRLPERARWFAEIWCLVAGSVLAGYFAYYSLRLVQVSIQIGDISQGTDATPLWIPQTAMAIGTTVMAIAMVERLILVLHGGPTSVARLDAKPEQT